MPPRIAIPRVDKGIHALPSQPQAVAPAKAGLPGEGKAVQQVSQDKPPPATAPAANAAAKTP